MLNIATFLARGFGEGAGPVDCSPPPPRLDLVPMFADHVPAVARIEAAVQARPWAEGRFHRAKPECGRFGTVALLAGSRQVAGYSVCALDIPTATLRVLRFAVAPDLTRKRIATRLFFRILDDAETDGLRVVEVPVPEQLSEPRKFLTSLGFRGDRVIPGYYGGEDAWVFTRRVNVDTCCGK